MTDTLLASCSPHTPAGRSGIALEFFGHWYRPEAVHIRFGRVELMLERFASLWRPRDWGFGIQTSHYPGERLGWFGPIHFAIARHAQH